MKLPKKLFQSAKLFAESSWHSHGLLLSTTGFAYLWNGHVMFQYPLEPPAPTVDWKVPVEACNYIVRLWPRGVTEMDFVIERKAVGTVLRFVVKEIGAFEFYLSEGHSLPDFTKAIPQYDESTQRFCVDSRYIDRIHKMFDRPVLIGLQEDQEKPVRIESEDKKGGVLVLMPIRSGHHKS